MRISHMGSCERQRNEQRERVGPARNADKSNGITSINDGCPNSGKGNEELQMPTGSRVLQCENFGVQIAECCCSIHLDSPDRDVSEDSGCALNEAHTDCSVDVQRQGKLEQRPVPHCNETSAQKTESDQSQHATPETLVTILHFNDVYQLSNLPRLMTAIRQEKSLRTNVIVTMGGDFLAPSLLSSLDNGAAMVRLFNLMGVDYVCFGNHEADIPYEALTQRISEFHGVWLNSNMPGFEPALPSHAAHALTGEDGSVGARTVGFLGLLVGGEGFSTLYRVGAMGGYCEGIVPVLRAHEAASAALRSEAHVDAIVPMTHQNVAEDRLMAASGMYPAILGGHDHDLITEYVLAGTSGCGGPERVSDGADDGGSESEGADDGSLRVPVLKAGQDAEHLIALDLVWPAGAARDAWPLVSHRVLPMADYAPNAHIAAAAEEAMLPLRKLECATLALLPKLRVPMPDGSVVCGFPKSKGSRLGPCTLTMYLATIMKQQTGAEVALVNSGAVRGEIDYGDHQGRLTYAQLMSECPFPSEFIVVEVLGSVLAEAVHASRRPWLSRHPRPHSGALQTDLGCRVNQKHELVCAANAPLEPERLYRTLCDTYDLRNNATLSDYVRRFPRRVPDADLGQPSLVILLESFCKQMWRTIAPRDNNGMVTFEQVNRFFHECDVDKDGSITAADMLRMLERALGEGASSFVADKMVEGGRVTRDELLLLLPTTVRGHARPDWMMESPCARRRSGISHSRLPRANAKAPAMETSAASETDELSEGSLTCSSVWDSIDTDKGLCLEAES